MCMLLGISLYLYLYLSIYLSLSLISKISHSHLYLYLCTGRFWVFGTTLFAALGCITFFLGAVVSALSPFFLARSLWSCLCVCVCVYVERLKRWQRWITYLQCSFSSNLPKLWSLGSFTYNFFQRHSSNSFLNLFSNKKNKSLSLSLSHTLSLSLIYIYIYICIYIYIYISHTFCVFRVFFRLISSAFPFLFIRLQFWVHRSLAGLIFWPKRDAA